MRLDTCTCTYTPAPNESARTTPCGLLPELLALIGAYVGDDDGPDGDIDGDGAPDSWRRSCSASRATLPLCCLLFWPAFFFFWSPLCCCLTTDVKPLRVVCTIHLSTPRHLPLTSCAVDLFGQPSNSHLFLSTQ